MVDEIVELYKIDFDLGLYQAQEKLIRYMLSHMSAALSFLKRKRHQLPR